MRILSLAAENIQRLSVVEIRPDGSSIVIVAGENEAGKSSCLDAIEMVLGGKDSIPTEPVRRGAAKGKVTLDLGDFIVTRSFQATGGTALTVTNRDGARYPSPQALLDGLYSRLTFDPLAFSLAKPAEQAATLRMLARIDTSDLEVSRDKAYAERTNVNRDLTRAQAALAGAVRYEDAGTEAETFEALAAALEAADDLSDAAVLAESAGAMAVRDLQAARLQVTTASDAVDAARRALDAAELEFETAQLGVALAEDAVGEKTAKATTARAAVPDRSALRTQIAAIQARNEKVAANKAHADLAAQVESHRKAADALTATVTTCDATKAERLASATFPVEGLGLDDNGVTWQGLPFEQASTAVRTRVSVAIGAALNPRLKVLLIRNGNDLDGKNLQLLAQFAEEHGLQLWVERIAGGAGLQTVVIEDGAVREPVTA